VKSRVTEDFATGLSRLPAAIQAKTRRAYQMWKNDPSHPSLHFKRIHSLDAIYSVRIGLGWRALGLMEEDGTMTWFWIGSHAEYDRLT
jgi:hypothetical protein